MEEIRIFPDVVAGISIGAVNGAIIAANPRNATHALEAFWKDLEVITPCLPFVEMRHAAAATKVLTFGVPQFFKPRWLPPFDGPSDVPWNWNSYYDASPLKQLISKDVDFTTLKTSPVRLLIGAVNVTSGELEIFDSYVDELTPETGLAYLCSTRSQYWIVDTEHPETPSMLWAGASYVMHKKYRVGTAGRFRVY